MTCERCGKEFNIDEATEEFEDETLKIYDNLLHKLCGKCAIDAINAGEDGIYYEICERCGKKYDPITVDGAFELRYSDENGTYATISDMTDLLLCLDCAIDEYND